MAEFATLKAELDRLRINQTQLMVQGCTTQVFHSAISQLISTRLHKDMYTRRLQELQVAVEPLFQAQAAMNSDIRPQYDELLPLINSSAKCFKLLMRTMIIGCNDNFNVANAYYDNLTHYALHARDEKWLAWDGFAVVQRAYQDATARHATKASAHPPKVHMAGGQPNSKYVAIFSHILCCILVNALTVCMEVSSYTVVCTLSMRNVVGITFHVFGGVVCPYSLHSAIPCCIIIMHLQYVCNAYYFLHNGMCTFYMQ
jgi:hypothetical protein